MFGSVCRCVCLDQPGKPVKSFCRSLTVNTACLCIVFCLFASTRGNWRHTCWAICPVVLDCAAWWPWKTICTEYQCLATHGGEMMCLFSHARTRLRGADREGTCSCEGAEFLWWCAVELGKALYLIVHLKGASVTCLSRVRHRGGCLWLRSMWQEDLRSCPAHFDSMLYAVATRYISFLQTRCVALRIDLRNTWMCIRVHFVVFQWLHDYQFSCSRSKFLSALCTRWSEVLGQMHTRVKTTDVYVGGLVCRVGARRPRCRNSWR